MNKNNAKSGPCLEISCDTFSAKDPRTFDLMHSAYCMHLISGYRPYSPPPYLRKLTRIRYNRRYHLRYWLNWFDTEDCDLMKFDHCGSRHSPQVGSLVFSSKSCAEKEWPWAQSLHGNGPTKSAIVRINRLTYQVIKYWDKNIISG